MSNRSGKHKRGNIRIGMYVTPKIKALAVYTAQLRGMTLTDLMLDGVRSIAIGAGVMGVDGKIAPEHELAIAAIERVLKESEVGDGI